MSSKEFFGTTDTFLAEGWITSLEMIFDVMELGDRDRARVDCVEFCTCPVTRRDLRVSEYPVEKLRTIPIDLGQNLIYFQMHRRHVYEQQVFLK
ncbi:hypothetical protein F511_39875 [Dorcoceras hygrometricum]|uniref:Uncharacterized protein n=1 Tax=Dorcoceras hygrometricum TaxID=472368 RepID=A0A2Z7DCC2_9LAMI|nr:hypothetical protein F511_39875 [Dorcoceras hygrometricum]